MKNTHGKDDSELSIIWMEQDAVTYFKVKSYSSGKVGGILPSKIKDVPGHKSITIELDGLFKTEDSDTLNRVQFDLQFDAKAGHSYNFKLKNGIHSLIYKNTVVCVLEERHDAVGSSINLAGSIRYPSSNASVVTCTKARLIPL